MRFFGWRREGEEAMEEIVWCGHQGLGTKMSTEKKEKGLAELMTELRAMRQIVAERAKTEMPALLERRNELIKRVSALEGKKKDVVAPIDAEIATCRAEMAEIEAWMKEERVPTTAVKARARAMRRRWRRRSVVAMTRRLGDLLLKANKEGWEWTEIFRLERELTFLERDGLEYVI